MVKIESEKDLTFMVWTFGIFIRRACWASSARIGSPIPASLLAAVGTKGQVAVFRKTHHPPGTAVVRQGLTLWVGDEGRLYPRFSTRRLFGRLAEHGRMPRTGRCSGE